jgi:hypothetical protein
MLRSKIIIGNGLAMLATKLGDLKCEVTQGKGYKFNVTLKEVKYINELWINLFSIHKALEHGFKLSNHGGSMCFTKGPISLSFHLY